MRPRYVVRFFFLGLMLVTFAFAGYEASSFRENARLFPLLLSLAAAILATLTLIGDIRRHPWRDRTAVPGVEAEDAGTFWEYSQPRVRYLNWAMVQVSLVYGFGISIGGLAFLVAFLVIEARVSWTFVIASVGVVLSVLTIFSRVMGLRLPPGIWELSNSPLP